jgi:hypothetical protein
MAAVCGEPPCMLRKIPETEWGPHQLSGRAPRWARGDEARLDHVTAAESSGSDPRSAALGSGPELGSSRVVALQVEAPNVSVEWISDMYRAERQCDRARARAAPVRCSWRSCPRWTRSCGGGPPARLELPGYRSLETKLLSFIQVL